MKEKNILHYTIGLNSFRGGGLTKYVDDITNYQSNDNNVFILYPGEFKILKKKIVIRKEKKVNDINVFSIVNPLSLPMMLGLKDQRYLYAKSDINIWKQFLVDNKIDIIHIHTLMGLYEEFIFAANDLKIPVIYTTHDYFGLCSKQTLIFNGKICKEWQKCQNCSKCNALALSNYKSYIVHSKMFYYIRKLKFFNNLKQKEKKKTEKFTSNSFNNLNEDFYINLRAKMINIFSLIDCFHFNSSISKMVFNMFLPNISGKVINITHKHIQDNRKLKQFNGKILKLTYLGPATITKGFYDIIEGLDNVYFKNNNVELNIYTYTNIERPYLKKNGVSYKYDDLPKIFDNTDLLISHSKGYETFGFTIIEALSYGVPVIVSSVTGAKDLVHNNFNGFIISDVNELSKVLLKLTNNKSILKEMNKNICNSSFYSFNEHCEDIYKLYLEVLKIKHRE